MANQKISRSLSRRTLLGATGCVAILKASKVQGQVRTPGVALVIGNSRYQWETPLPNVRRDAPDIAKSFEALGLKTELLQDAGLESMRQALARFESAAQGARFAAFYFAGHGVASQRDNYLVPIDADIGADSIIDKVLHQSAVMEALKGASSRLAVFDACRNNPSGGNAQRETERAAVVNPDLLAGRLANMPNTLMLFSTAAGRVALDGPAGDNSPFAMALLRQLGGPAVDMQSLPAKLRRDLLIATDGRQVLWDLNGYRQPFILKAGRPPATGVLAAPPHAPGIIELPQAYAFATANGIPLPDGLVALRSRLPGEAGQRVGSYAYNARNMEKKVTPYMMIVLSVDENKTAQIIMAGNNRGPYWRFVTAPMSKDGVEFIPMQGSSRFAFRWKDVNSGSLTQSTANRNNPIKLHEDSFRRLDG